MPFAQRTRVSCSYYKLRTIFALTEAAPRTDAIFLGFSEAFEAVPRKRLIT